MIFILLGVILAVGSACYISYKSKQIFDDLTKEEQELERSRLESSMADSYMENEEKKHLLAKDDI